MERGAMPSEMLSAARLEWPRIEPTARPHPTQDAAHAARSLARQRRKPRFLCNKGQAADSLPSQTAASRGAPTCCIRHRARLWWLFSPFRPRHLCALHGAEDVPGRWALTADALQQERLGRSCREGDEQLGGACKGGPPGILHGGRVMKAFEGLGESHCQEVCGRQWERHWRWSVVEDTGSGTCEGHVTVGVL